MDASPSSKGKEKVRFFCEVFVYFLYSGRFILNEISIKDLKPGHFVVEEDSYRNHLYKVLSLPYKVEIDKVSQDFYGDCWNIKVFDLQDEIERELGGVEMYRPTFYLVPLDYED